MARYRKVEVKTWNDGKFRELSPIQPCGQGLWIWFLTGTRTTNIPGVVIGTDVVMAAELRWPIEAFLKAFEEGSSRGMVKADWKAGLVWLPNASRAGDKRNKPESPNVIRSWRDTWDEIPECALKLEIWQQLKGFADAFGKGFKDAFLEACRKPYVKAMPNQEQEQEQEQEQKHTESARFSGREGEGSNGTGHCPFDNDAGLTLEQAQQLQRTYPEGSYRQSDWLVVQKLINQHLANGVAFERIKASFERYRAQIESRGKLGTDYVLSPVKHCDLERPLFDEPFPLSRSKAESTVESNVSAGLAFLAGGDPA